MNTARAWQRGSSLGEPAVLLGSLVLALLTGFLVADQGPRAFLAIVGLFVGLIVLRWPFVGLLALVGTIAVENLLVLEGVRGVATGSRFIGMMVFGAWLLGKLLRRESFAPLFTSALFATALFLFAFALSSMLWARYPQAALTGSFRLVQFIALALVTFDLARTWQRLDLLIKALVLGATLAALLTIEQAVIGGARRAGDHIAGGMNTTAMVLVTTLPFAFYLLRSSTRTTWKALGIGYIGLAVTAVILTYSRLNLLVLPVILILLSFHTLVGRRGRGPILVAAVVGIGVGLYAVPVDRLQARLETIAPYLQSTVAPSESGVIEHSPRGYHLRLGIAIARDHPVIGAGYMNYGHLFRDEYQFFVPGAPRLYQSVRSPHSTHVGMLANLGVIGFALWIALLLGGGLIPAVRAWRRTARDRHGTPHLMAQAITYAIGMQVLVYGWYGSIDLQKGLWVLLGLAVAMSALVNAGTQSSMERRVGGSIAEPGNLV